MIKRVRRAEAPAHVVYDLLDGDKGCARSIPCCTGLAVTCGRCGSRRSRRFPVHRVVAVDIRMARSNAAPSVISRKFSVARAAEDQWHADRTGRRRAYSAAAHHRPCSDPPAKYCPRSAGSMPGFTRSAHMCGCTVVLRRNAACMHSRVSTAAGRRPLLQGHSAPLFLKPYSWEGLKKLDGEILRRVTRCGAATALQGHVR